jgi:DNA polymerase III subunit epsilon
MLPSYVVLDLETTGGSAVCDRITEIAAVRIENGQTTARWSSLVNPGTPIPYFIQNLTGISDDMVADAPRFKDLSDKVLSLLDGAVLVAHNASFDHGFLRGEFARIGHELRVPTLCSVRLSRKLYPQFRSHSLDALIQRHGLHTDARHRAMGDVDMVLAWLAQAQGELGLERLRGVAHELLQPPLGLPLQLETLIGDVPDSPGAYLFFDGAAPPLFIGSAANLRQRVSSHLQSASQSARERGIVANTRRIEWRETAGELGALLLAKRLIGQLHPTYGRSAKPLVSVDLRALHAWPHSGPIGLREHDADSGRSDIHVFMNWRHLGSVNSESELVEVLERTGADDTDGNRAVNRADGLFDLDIYRLLVKRLLGPGASKPGIIRF